MQGFLQTLRLDHITCYEGLSVPFAYLLNHEFAKNHFFLNPNTTAQRHVTVEDRRKLIELATPSANTPRPCAAANPAIASRQ
jgi:hypothetical protein